MCLSIILFMLCNFFLFASRQVLTEMASWLICSFLQISKNNLVKIVHGSYVTFIVSTVVVLFLFYSKFHKQNSVFCYKNQNTDDAYVNCWDYSKNYHRICPHHLRWLIWLYGLAYKKETHSRLWLMVWQIVLIVC